MSQNTFLIVCEGETAKESLEAAISEPKRCKVITSGGIAMNIFGKNKGKLEANEVFKTIQASSKKFTNIVLASDGDISGHYQNLILIAFIYKKLRILFESQSVSMLNVPFNTSVGSLSEEFLTEMLRQMLNGESSPTIAIELDNEVNSTLELTFAADKQSKKNRDKWINEVLLSAPASSIDFGQIQKITLTDYLKAVMPLHFLATAHHHCPDWSTGTTLVQSLTVEYLLTVGLLTNGERVDRLASEIGKRNNRKESDEKIQESLVRMARNSLGTNNLTLLTPHSFFGKKSDSARHGARYRTVSIPHYLKNIYPAELRMPEKSLRAYALESDGKFPAFRPLT